ncbi:hypothetical protein JM47_03455 [Ureaplasma diversum]|uniref:DUF3196 domain-containing protein n=1 Tax=Ureaplasma diversum TaxID=42094 RepID=A0A0C5RLK3_9BACT|nr:DUF3196 family protein [Ureaplasma diversum]AJQ45583.1 hypothetical protein JM47_03455 [Ureaplasma diversum]
MNKRPLTENEKKHIKKYFDDILLKVKEAKEHKDYSYAYDLLSLEFKNPLIDIPTLERFQSEANEIIREAEMEWIEQNEAKFTKNDYYNQIYNLKTNSLSIHWLEFYIYKFVNEFNEVDIAFLESLFKNKVIKPSDKLQAFDLLVVNNIDIEIEYYNSFFNKSMKLKPNQEFENFYQVWEQVGINNIGIAFEQYYYEHVKDQEIYNLLTHLSAFCTNTYFPFNSSLSSDQLFKLIDTFTKSILENKKLKWDHVLNEQEKEFVSVLELAMIADQEEYLDDEEFDEE